MRLLVLVLAAGLTVGPAFAELVVDPHAPWSQRINPCAAAWNGANSEHRGSMSYNQFIRKCVGGRTALPFKTKALCADRTTSAGDAPEGACVYNGGVQEWLN